MTRKILLFCLSLLFSGMAHSGEFVVALAKTDYPPFYYYDEKKERFQGVSVEICEAIASQLGHHLTYRRYPFARVLHNLNAGTVDMACNLFNTGDRAPGITYTGVPHVFEKVWIISLKENNAPSPITVETLQNFITGGIRGYYYGPAITNSNNLPILLLNDEAHLIRTLLSKRIDFMLGNKTAIELYAEKLGASDLLTYYEPPIYDGPIYMGFSREKERAHRHVAAFTEAIVHFRTTQMYRNILEKYQIEVPKF